jgi:hypothetical protein
MDATHKRSIIGRALGGGIAIAVISALTLFVGAGTAASTEKPRVVNPPHITGTPEQGKTLTGDRGDWANKPKDYNYSWLRCDENGGSCAVISGAHAVKYTLTSADVGNTLRFRVTAINGDGQRTATSVPTAVIRKPATTTTTTSTPTPKPASNGCPTGNPKQVANMSLPTKLILDRFESNPRVLTAGTHSFQLRVHVTSTAPCGGDVQGALVYGTATPFNQFTIEEQSTDSSGWASLSFQRLNNFPVNSKQGILAMFLRARKSGENVLGGVTGYRLVSVPVNLHG